ncbi:hypothetical protein Bbelb_224460 [Branchiostoma belcheri]|nr:hypothetical protein Bbelb_224460 [Branchiostoma belcheri]
MDAFTELYIHGGDRSRKKKVQESFVNCNVHGTETPPQAPNLRPAAPYLRISIPGSIKPSLPAKTPLRDETAIFHGGPDSAPFSAEEAPGHISAVSARPVSARAYISRIRPPCISPGIYQPYRPALYQPRHISAVSARPVSAQAYISRIGPPCISPGIYQPYRPALYQPGHISAVSARPVSAQAYISIYPGPISARPYQPARISPPVSVVLGDRCQTTTSPLRIPADPYHGRSVAMGTGGCFEVPPLILSRPPELKIPEKTQTTGQGHLGNLPSALRWRQTDKRACAQPWDGWNTRQGWYTNSRSVSSACTLVDKQTVGPYPRASRAWYLLTNSRFLRGRNHPSMGSCGVAAEGSTRNLKVPGSSPDMHTCHRSCALGKGTLHDDFPHFAQQTLEQSSQRQLPAYYRVGKLPLGPPKDTKREEMSESTWCLMKPTLEESPAGRCITVSENFRWASHIRLLT